MFPIILAGIHRLIINWILFRRVHVRWWLYMKIFVLLIKVVISIHVSPIWKRKKERKKKVLCVWIAQILNNGVSFDLLHISHFLIVPIHFEASAVELEHSGMDAVQHQLALQSMCKTPYRYQIAQEKKHDACGVLCPSRLNSQWSKRPNWTYPMAVPLQSPTHLLSLHFFARPVPIGPS